MHDDWMEYELIFNIPWDVRDSGDNDEQVQEGRRIKIGFKGGPFERRKNYEVSTSARCEWVKEVIRPSQHLTETHSLAPD